MAEPIQLILSREELNKRRGGRDGLYGLFESGLTWDVVHWFDDFLGDEIRGSGATPGTYEVVTGTDGDITILADQPNGVADLRATAAGVGAGNEYCGLSIPELGFTAVRNAVIAVRCNIDTVSDVKVEIGFTDVTTDAGAVNSKSGATFNADDFVGWVLDTTENSLWDGMGVDSTTAMTTLKPELDAPVAGTFETMIVALREYFDENHPSTTNKAAAKFIRLDSNGRKTYESPWQTDAITSTVALVPWVFVQERNAADRGLRIDFIDVRARRTEG